MPEKNSHCSYCGTAFDAAQPWPRTCAGCGKKTYLNPTPVAVMLLPVDGGLLVIRRLIPPRQGSLALPGGFINLGESWQQAGAREVFEETGVTISPVEITLFDVLSAPDSTVLIFGIASPRAASDLPAFAANSEATEMRVIDAPAELAFPLHTRAVERFFAQRNLPHKAAYV